MAINDIIIRRGPKDKQIVQGPELLFGPTSDRRHRVGADVDRITGDVDFYEINSEFCGIPGVGGTPAGTYTWMIEPFQERGFRRPIKAIRVVAVVKLTDHVDGSQTTELLFRKTVPASDRRFTIGPVTAKPKERLFLAIERMGGVSSIQYKLSLDAELSKDNITPPSPIKPMPSQEMSEDDAADKAWDLVKQDPTVPKPAKSSSRFTKDLNKD